MKHLYVKLCVLLFFVVNFNSTVNAQDRVILVNGDTLKCSIYKENSNFLFFKQNSRGVSTKGKISKNQVAEWTYQGTNSNQVTLEPQNPPDLINEVIATEKKEPKKTERDNPFRVNINIGSGLMVGNTEKAIEDLQNQGVPKEDAENYSDDVVVGHTAKITLYYQFLKNYWLGAQYNGFYSNAKMLTQLDYDGYNWVYGEMGEKNFINFVGPSFYSSSSFGRKKRMAVHSSYTIGPVFYRNEAEVMRQQVLLTGITLGQNLDLGIEYFIKPRWSISMDASLFSSRLNKVTAKTVYSSEEIDLDKDNNSLSRFDLSAGVVFYW